MGRLTANRSVNKKREIFVQIDYEDFVSFAVLDDELLPELNLLLPRIPNWLQTAKENNSANDTNSKTTIGSSSAKANSSRGLIVVSRCLTRLYPKIPQQYLREVRGIVVEVRKLKLIHEHSSLLLPQLGYGSVATDEIRRQTRIAVQRKVDSPSLKYQRCRVRQFLGSSNI